MKQKELNRIIYSKSIDVYSKFVSQSHVSCLYGGTCSFHPKWVFQNMFESDKMIISILSRSKVHQNFQNLQCSNTSFDSPDADWEKMMSANLFQRQIDQYEGWVLLHKTASVWKKLINRKSTFDSLEFNRIKNKYAKKVFQIVFSKE